jgi:hypothetical protein
MALYRNQKGEYVEAGSVTPGPDWYPTSYPLPSGGGGGGGVGISPASLYQSFAQKETQAREANLKREKEIRKTYADILNSISGSNASLRASGLADIETQAQGLIGQETQQQISSGLYGTTTAAAIPRNVAASFTQPSRLKLEDMLAQRKREAQLGLAGFVERIETPYPDYNALMNAMIAAQT